MYSVTIITSFSGAHHLRNYKGKCENLHGHNWKVETTVSGTALNKSGLLLDFTDLKIIVNELLENFDHKHLNKVKPFDKLNPTSEIIAKYIHNEIKNRIQNDYSKLELSKIRITVWESDRQWASYTE
ncbi:MAG: 6-carboxytetrahydropterin synthase QueD [Elusimicrobia bacterium]|nr:6-carboxytetrahydropterin synthase QueD [Elusimicrobiota bacterium]MBU2613952.1 6-carboxytetrahydropterin synthase QueD [Elusimicrobiota bacterium]